MPTPPPSPTPNRFALLGLALSMLLSSLGTSIANVALPTLVQELASSFGAVPWVVLAYLFAITGSLLVAGRLGDMLGRKRLLRAGLLLFTAASLLAGLAPNLAALVAARVLQGLGAAVMMALTVAFVTELVPETETGRAMGWLGTTSAIGTALGPSLGGLLIELAGWRAIFLLNLPLGAGALLLAKRYLPVDPTRPSEARVRFNVLGMLASFRDPRLRASLVANLLVSAVLMATMIVGPFYLSIALALGTRDVGLVMSVGPAVAALTGVPAGRWVDRYGAQRSAAAGLMGVTAGALALAVLPAALHVLGYVVPIAVITAHYALFQAANNASIMRDAPPQQRGVISGALGLSRNLGLITGASAMGAVFAAATGASDVTSASPEAVARGMHVTFALAAVLGAIGVALLARSQASPSRYEDGGPRSVPRRSSVSSTAGGPRSSSTPNRSRKPIPKASVADTHCGPPLGWMARETTSPSSARGPMSTKHGALCDHVRPSVAPSCW